VRRAHGTHQSRRKKRRHRDPLDRSYPTFLARPPEERKLLIDIGFITDLFQSHPLREPDDRLVDLSNAFSLLLTTWIVADFRLLALLSKNYAARYRQFMDNLRSQYRIRCSKNPNTASHWLLGQIDRMELPDFRRYKTHQDDLTLVNSYDALKKAFAPAFRSTSRDDRFRATLAKLATVAVGRRINAEDLEDPTGASLSDYCQLVLHTSAVNLSRARQRLRKYNLMLTRSLSREVSAVLAVLRRQEP